MFCIIFSVFASNWHKKMENYQIIIPAGNGLHRAPLLVKIHNSVHYILPVQFIFQAFVSSKWATLTTSTLRMTIDFHNNLVGKWNITIKWRKKFFLTKDLGAQWNERKVFWIGRDMRRSINEEVLRWIQMQVQ